MSIKNENSATMQHEAAQIPKTAGPLIRCSSCGDEIRSRHRHDMRWCRCGDIAVDGGADYLRMASKEKASWTLVDEPDRGTTAEKHARQVIAQRTK